MFTSPGKQYKDGVMGSGVSACSNMFVYHVSLITHSETGTVMYLRLYVLAS